MFLELVSVETGIVIAKKEITIPRGDIPSSLSILPDNYNDALYILDELYEVVNADNFIRFGHRATSIDH